MTIDAARIARLITIAEQVWEREKDARTFMREPHPLLDGKSPLELAESELGARKVQRLLAHLEHSIPI